MIDLGLDKLALIGVVALVVLGPEKLPRVARTVGNLVGRAQRYVAEVKSEVNRQMDLEELKKMKTEMESAAQEVQHSIEKSAGDLHSSMQKDWNDVTAVITDGSASSSPSDELKTPEPDVYYGGSSKAKRNTFRLKQTAVPRWYKQRAGVRSRMQSGAARVARYRPKGLKPLN